MIRKNKLSKLIIDLDNCYREIDRRYAETGSHCRKIEKQLRCAAKGHNFVFDRYVAVFCGLNLSFSRPKHQFKCSKCNLTITKTEDELTPKEKKALKDLKIIGEDNAKTTN